MAQLALIEGYYRCHGCGRDVDETRRTRRFQLCPDCWQEVMPSFPKTVSKPGRDPAWNAKTEEELAQIQAYWEWYGEIEEQYPLGWKYYRFRPADTLPELSEAHKLNLPARGPQKYFNMLQHSSLEGYTTDSFYPICECGEERPEYEHGIVRSLFGKARARYCPTCEAKKSIESLYDMAAGLYPDFDDEDWLDLLYKSHPEAFKLGVLPDYWFELKRHKDGEEE